MVAVYKIKETLKLNKSAFVGMCMFNLSKTLMQNFSYNYIKKKKNDHKVKILIIGIDSLKYETETIDVWRLL